MQIETEIINGRYEILDELEPNGQDQRFILLKLLNNEYYELTIIDMSTVNSAPIMRAKREIKILSVLNHPQITSIIDWGIKEKFLYMIRTVKKGIQLNEWWISTYKNPQLFLTQMINAFDIIDYLHKNQVFHRGITPNSMVVTETGRINFVNAGTAYMAGLARITRYVGLNFTEYLAPEQLASLTGEKYEISDGIDIFSAAVVFYESLTGHFPFKCVQGPSVRIPQYDNKAYDLRKFLPRIPKAFAELFNNMLSVETDNRTKSASAVSARLFEIISSRGMMDFQSAWLERNIA